MDLKKEINKDKDEYPVYTLEQCYNDFIEQKKQEKITEKTLKKYKRVYETLINFINPRIDLNSLSDKDFSSYYDYIVKSDFANKTKAYYINYVKLMLNNAYNAYKVKNKLMERYKLSESKKQQQTYLPFTEKDLKKLFEYYKNDKNTADIMMILLHTGMRIGELANLMNSDINLKERTILIASQGGKTKNARRLIYIHSKIFNIVKELKKQSNDKYLINLGENIKNRPDTLSKKMNRAVSKIITDKRKVVHSFRKNFAQKLYEVSPSEHIIKYIMGHSQVDNLTFDIYNLGKINFEQIKDVINKINYKII